MTDLLSSMMRAMSVDYSTQCNLRCSYCHTSTAEHVNTDMSDALLHQIYDYAYQGKVGNIWLSASGETTMYESWRERLAHFLDDPNLLLHINSNFARNFKDEDLRSLLKLRHIQISIDSVEPEMLKKQRGADVRTVISNLVRLLLLKAETGAQTVIRFNCTVTRDSITHVEGVARLAVLLGIRDLQLSEAIETPGAPRMPDTLDKLTDAEALAFTAAVVNAAQILKNRVEFTIQDSLVSKLTPIIAAIQAGTQPINPAASFAAEDARPVKSACIQAWDTVVIAATGEVRPCCGSWESLGNANEERIIDIVDGPKARAFRQRLLDGGPDIPCTKCHLAKVQTREQTEDMVRAEHELYARERQRARPPAPVPA